jgi:two-component system, LytTR family, response regulator
MPDRIRCVLVDDESLARDLLRHHLAAITGVELVGEAVNGFDALKLIREQVPDLVFLDIQMPKLNGFEMLELIDNPPEVIFCTAYDEYAVKAFEKHAVDYLLKPFDLDRLREAVRRAEIRINAEKHTLPEAYSAVSNALQGTHQGLQRIVVKTGTRIHVIPVETIFYIEASEDYVMIFSETGKHLKENTMKYYETHLPGEVFVRVHRSYLVNIHHIVSISRYGKESFIASISNGDTIRVSASGFKRLSAELNY